MLFNGKNPAASVDILHDEIVKAGVAFVADNYICFAEFFAVFGECLRHTARENNNAVGMKLFKLSDRLTGFSVAFGGDRAGVYDIDICLL